LLYVSNQAAAVGDELVGKRIEFRATQLATVAVAMVGIALAARPVAAEDVHCPPHRGKTTVNGNLLVAASCELDETHVKGNVLLFAGGSLVADEATIDGNIEAYTAFEVELVDSRVRGNVELVELVGDSSSFIESRVDGDVELRGNRSFVLLEDNEVDSIEALQNIGGLHIIDNEVKGDLTCRDNSPAPTGGANEVRGDEQGQCLNLAERKDEDEDGGEEDDDEEDDDDTPGGSGGSVVPGGTSGGGSGSGSGSNGASGGNAGGSGSSGGSGSDVPPINLINEPSGGGGSTDLLTLLATSVLLVGLRKWRPRGRRLAGSAQPRLQPLEIASPRSHLRASWSSTCDSPHSATKSFTTPTRSRSAAWPRSRALQ
jgi:uncharacterized membrane protein YgcG